MDPPEEDLPPLPHEIAAPEEYLPGTPLWVWAVLALSIILSLAVLIIIIRYFRNRKGATPPPPIPDIYRTAESKLEEFGALATKLPLGEFATGISLIIRECLAKALNDPALYETEEELAARATSLKRLPPSVRDLLLNLSQAKYAPSQVDETKGQHYLTSARQSIREIQQSLAPPSLPTE